MGMRIRLAFQFDAGPDPSFHMAADPDPTFYFDADPDPVLHFDTNPERLPEITQIHRIRNTVRELYTELSCTGRRKHLHGFVWIWLNRDLKEIIMFNSYRRV